MLMMVSVLILFADLALLAACASLGSDPVAGSR
jgi:hypothetical protein